MKAALSVLTLNAARTAHHFIDSLEKQSVKGLPLLCMDSSSTDGTREIFAARGFEIHELPRQFFDHGGARQNAVEILAGADIIIFLTQDALLADSFSLEKLLQAFDDPAVGAAFGRQLPAKGATPIAAHARLFNYPANSRIKTVADVPVLGIKTAFISNSFAAYRRAALEATGGFPHRCIVSEDTCVAAKMLLAGWKVAYCADAPVYHSHNYSLCQEFQRYFDVGVFHAREPWIRKAFGGAEGEGLRFLKSEMKYLFHHAPVLVFSSFTRSIIKYLGFKAGLLEGLLPDRLKPRLSMQKTYWRHDGSSSS